MPSLIDWYGKSGGLNALARNTVNSLTSDEEPAWRANMLPFTQDEEGHTALGWPQLALPLKGAMQAAPQMAAGMAGSLLPFEFDHHELEPGNIDLANRPMVRNDDGTTSTVRSMSANIDGREVLMPTVSDDGRILSDDMAIEQYLLSGKHLGKYDTPQSATEAAQRLHINQARQYGLSQGFNPRGGMGGQAPGPHFATPPMITGLLDDYASVDAWAKGARDEDGNALQPNKLAGINLGGLAPLGGLAAGGMGMARGAVAGEAGERAVNMLAQEKPTIMGAFRDSVPGQGGTINDFATSRLLPNDGSSLKATRAYEDYVDWADVNRVPPMDYAAFNDWMSGQGYSKQHIAGSPRFIGVGVPETDAAGLSQASKPSQVRNDFFGMTPSNEAGTAALDPYERSTLNADWRKKVARTGELFSNSKESAAAPLATNALDNSLPMDQASRMAEGVRRKPHTLEGGPGGPENTDDYYSPLQMYAMRGAAYGQIAGETAAQYRLNRHLGESFTDSVSEATRYARELKQDMASSWREEMARAKAGPGESFNYDIRDADGNHRGLAKGIVRGDTMHFDWLGGADEDANSLGVGALRQLRESVRKDFPHVKKFEGERISGARRNNENTKQSVYIKSNPDEALAAPLALNALEQQSPEDIDSLLDRILQGYAR